MKKMLFLVIISLMAISASAQLNFGVKTGYNSSLTLKNMGDVANGSYNLVNVQNEFLKNFQAGAFLRLGIKKFYLQPEVYYSVQKKDYQITFKDVANNDVTLNKFVNINTVDIPVLLGIKLLDVKIANVRAFAGPKFRLNANSTLSYTNIAGGNFDVNQIIPDLKNSTIGAEAGVGVDLLMFTVDARLSLSDNIAQSKLNTTTLPSLTSNTFIISVGWKLF